MIVCQIWGDLYSEKSSENYPTEVFCDECFEDMNKPPEEGQDGTVLNTQEWDESWGDSCYKCGKTVEEELEEKS